MKEDFFRTSTYVIIRRAILQKEMCGIKHGVILKDIYLDLQTLTPVFEALNSHDNPLWLDPFLSFQAAAVSPFRILDELKSFFQRGHSLHNRYHMHKRIRTR